MDANTAELRWGVDDAGSTIGIDRHPKGAELIEELGFDLIVHHYQPARRIADNVQYLREFDRWCNEQGIAWVANLEQSNWVEKCVDETRRDVEACVGDGATCIALPHLLPERVIAETGRNGARNDDKGMWVATTDFLAPHVAEHVAHVLPPEDELRYRFGDTQIVFRPVDGDPNRLSVTEEPVE